MITKMTKTNIYIILTLPLSSKPTLQTLTLVLVKNLLRDSFLRMVTLPGVDNDEGNDNLALNEAKESSENDEHS